MSSVVYLTDGRDSRFSRYYEKLYQIQQDCDVVFYCQEGKRTIRAHLPILVEYSTYFAKKSLTAKRKPINVYLTYEQFNYIEYIIRVIYFRQETIPKSFISKLQTMAQVLGIDIYFEPPEKWSRKIQDYPTGIEPMDTSDKENCDPNKSSRGRGLNGKRVGENSPTKVENQLNRSITRSMSAKNKKNQVNLVEKQKSGDPNPVIPACDINRYCFECQRLYSTKQALIRHKRTKHADQHCSMCDFIGTVEGLENHYSTFHNLTISLTCGGKRKRTGTTTKSGPGNKSKKQKTRA